MKKRIAIILIAAICAFACAFAFTGCADQVQKNCNHSWVLQRNDSALRDPTCSEKGISAVYKCWKCQKTQYEYSPTIPHTFDESKNSISYCGQTVTWLRQTCEVCNTTVSAKLDFAVHKLTKSTHYDATDDGENHVCAHTDYQCALCYKTIYSDYEHSVGESTLETIKSFEEEAKNGSCGSTLTVRCEDCFNDVQYFFHQYDEADEEVLFIDSTCKIVKKVCTVCNYEAKYEISFFIDGNWVKNPN